MPRLKSIYVLRHGDRFDFEDKERWAKIAPERPLDPVLSDLGILQSIKLGTYFKEGIPSLQGPKITRCLTSPFVRCIQTINPIAGATDSKICVENSLWECVFTNEVMPSLRERQSYFPRIDPDYESIFKPVPDEGFPKENMERYARAANGIVDKFKDTDGAIVICTHAAGVAAIVASLMKVKVGDIKPVAPASIYRLDYDGNANKWCLHEELDGTTEHLDNIKGETYPWPSPEMAYDTWGAQYIKCSETASWMTS